MVLFKDENKCKCILYSINYEDVPSIIHWYTVICDKTSPVKLNRFFRNCLLIIIKRSWHRWERAIYTIYQSEDHSCFELFRLYKNVYNG